MSDKYRNVAQEVLKHVGGEGNISHLEHCSTRLRFSINDPAKVNKDALKATSGVMGVVGNGNQCQVVIGNDVIEVYDELVKLGSFDNASSDASSSGEKKNISAMVLDFMVGVFQPLIPAIAGAGILKAMLSLLVLIGLMEAGSPWHTILNNGADAALYFLPVMAACTMATKLNINRLVAIAVVGAQILPSITNALAKGVSLFGFQLQNVQYSYQVFPAILTVAVLYFVEKFFTKISPKPIRVFFVPMMCFIIVVPLSLLVLAPLGYNIGQVLTSVILFVYAKLGWIAVALLASILPFMISLGMHKALVPYAVGAITTSGVELLYMPASLAHNISEGGACLAVALKTKDDHLRQAAISAGISGIFGITEPALYGVTLQHRKAMTGVIAGSFIGGLVIGLLGLKAFVAMGPGLAGMAMFVDPVDSLNIVWGFIGFGVSLAVSFIVTLFLFRDSAQASAEPEPEESVKPGKLFSPMDGVVVPLEKVNDEVFSSGMLGQGVAVLPDKGELYSPIDGTITMIPESKHAISVVDASGAEILMHIGMDTVKLAGKGYTPQVKAGDKVKKGQLLMKFDIEAIKSAGYDLITPVVITNSDNIKVQSLAEGNITRGTELLKWE